MKLRQDFNVKYSLEGTSSNFFNIDGLGQVTLSLALDREEIATHFLTIVCETTFSQHFSSSKQIIIHVLDVNDNKPFFYSKSFKVSIHEDILPGVSFTKVTAQDKDEGINGAINYWLEDSDGLFSVDRVTGWISVVGPLDRETQSEYFVVVTAGDNGNIVLTDKAIIEISIIDVNDNPPVFTEEVWNTSIGEDSAIDTTVMQLHISDADAIHNSLAYYIISGDPYGLFKINTMGELVIFKTLDREKNEYYNLTVVASDGKFSAITTVVIDIIDVNDELPYCLQTIYKSEISEAAPLGTYITTIKANDPDVKPSILYSLSGKDADLFSINEFTGVVRTKSLLDREKQSSFKFTAEVRDEENSKLSCTSAVIIDLLDVNDNSPQFRSSNLTTSILENSPAGSLVIKVNAIDNDIGINRKIRYLLLDSANGQFEIVPDTGVVLLSTPLDRESRDSYTLIVEGTDKGRPQLSSLINIHINVLDVNDNSPVFSKNIYFGNVSEDSQPRTIIVKVKAISIDIGVNAEISYTIIKGNEDNQFYIDPYTGVIGVLQTLDYERVKDYILTVEATDRGEPPLSSQAFVNISVIDSNDNPPIFTEIVYSVSIPEDIHIGKPIMQVLANDMDSGNNNIVSYTIGKNYVSNPFSIDTNSGYITVIKPLDREVISEYKLVVRATDSGKPPLSSTTSVVIELLDVNDNPPLFTQQNYTAIVQEGRNPGWFVIKIRVTDADSEINGGPFIFDIRGGNGVNFFQINNDGTVQTAAILDRRLHESFVLHIRAFDSGTPPLYSDTYLTIMVIEESQYPPFVKSMNVTVMSYEDNLKSSPLGRIYATDLDPYDSLTFSIASKTESFIIDPKTGLLSMVSNTDLGQYLVNVSVSDGRFTSYATIIVKVQPIRSDMLSSAISIRLKDISGENFILGGLEALLNSLRSALKTEVTLLSIKPVNKDLDLLISIIGGSSLDEMNTILIELGLPAILLNCSCLNDGLCRQRLSILPNNIITTATDVYSFVAPSHSYYLYCACSLPYTGDQCEMSLEETCDCPPPMVCSHQGTIGEPFTCSSPPPVAPLCALNHSCHSSNQHALSSVSFTSNYIIVLIILGLVIALSTTFITLRKRMKKRKQAQNVDKETVTNPDEKCPSKLINLQTSKYVGHPSCGTDSMYTAVLNNVDPSQTYTSSGNNSEKIPSHYGQNQVNLNDSSTKIINGLHWECSEWRHSTSCKLPNIDEVSGSEVDSSSSHSNDSNSPDSNNGCDREPLSRFEGTRSDNENSAFRQQPHSDFPV